jgi:adenine specific DNA methylase Mod
MDKLLLENILKIEKIFLKDSGSIFARCDLMEIGLLDLSYLK